jgi:hypothetical protein
MEMITDYSAGICFVLGAAPEGRFRCDGSSLQAMPKKPPKELNTPAHKFIVAPYRLEDGEWAAEIVRPAAERGRIHNPVRRRWTAPERFIASRPRELGDEEHAKGGNEMSFDPVDWAVN